MESLFAYTVIVIVFGIVLKMFKSIFKAILIGLILFILLSYFGIISLS